MIWDIFHHSFIAWICYLLGRRNRKKEKEDNNIKDAQ